MFLVVEDCDDFLPRFPSHQHFVLATLFGYARVLFKLSLVLMEALFATSNKLSTVA